LQAGRWVLKGHGHVVGDLAAHDEAFGERHPPGVVVAVSLMFRPAVTDDDSASRGPVTGAVQRPG
jgi:hypothetical protein